MMDDESISVENVAIAYSVEKCWKFNGKPNIGAGAMWKLKCRWVSCWYFWELSLMMITMMNDMSKAKSKHIPLHMSLHDIKMSNILYKNVAHSPNMLNKLIWLSW